MNELTLSNNLAQIELEINHHKQIAGQSIWEIGRRLKYVKENDLAHGQFLEWLTKMNIERTEAHRMMKVAEKLPNVATLQHLGTTALHLIATLPEEEKEEQIQRIEDGDNPTVRELQEIKKKLKLSQETNSLLRDENERIRLSKSETKEVVKKVVPEDYITMQNLNRQLLEKNNDLNSNLSIMQDNVTALGERNKFLQSQLEKLNAERAEEEEKSAKYDELTKAIAESEGQLNEYQKKIGAYKNILSLIQKGNDFLANMGGLIYADEIKVIRSDGIVGDEFNSFILRGMRFFTDLDNARNKKDEILEGEFK